MKKKKLSLSHILLGIYTLGYTLLPILAFSQQYNTNQIPSLKLNAVIQDGKIILNIPESALGKELLITAQVDEGAGLRNRPLSSIGVVRLQKSTDGSKILFNKERYEERITDKNSKLKIAFTSSNQQPWGLDYPIINRTEKTGFYAIDITKAILNGENWYQLQMQNLFPTTNKQIVTDTIITFNDGIYAAFKQEYRTQSKFNSNIEIRISCTIRLLDKEPLHLRYANHHFPYTYLTFKNYSRIPYGAINDTIICRWRIHSKKPLICCIDPYCPPSWIPYIKKGIIAWNKAFEQAGIKNAIEIHENIENEIPALHHFVISYDLGTATTTRQQITHPETGEILYARLNLGHGLLVPYLNNYWWECGFEDNRIRKDIHHQHVAGEILQAIIMREVGLLLGLTAPSPENYWKESVLQQSNYEQKILYPSTLDCKQIAWGYQQISMSKDAIKERKQLEKIILPNISTITEQNIQKEKILTQKLKNHEAMFSFLKTKVAQNGVNQQYIDLYNQGIQNLTDYLKKLTNIISTKNMERIFPLLDYYVFQEKHNWLDIPTLRTGCWTSYQKIVNNIGNEVFQSLFQQQTIDALTQQIESDNSQSDNPTIWDKLHTKIWNQFNTKHKLSAHQMEIQALYVNVLVTIVQNLSDQNSCNYIVTITQELQFLKEQLKKLQKKYQKEEDRIHYKLLLERIK